MKKMTIFMSMLLSFGLLLTYSCTKDDSEDDGVDPGPSIPVKTRLVEHNDLQAIDSTLRTFTYNSKKMVDSEIYKDKNDVAFKVIKYTYSSSDKLVSSLEYQDEALTIVASSTNYTLNSSGLITKSVNDRGGNITTSDYTYNSSKLATAHIEYTGASTADPIDLEFDWTGEIITKITYKVPDTTGGSGMVVQKYEEYSYDAKTNPYFIMNLPGHEPMLLCPNNVTEIKEYDSFNILQKKVTITYNKYDGDLPEMAFYDLGFQQGVYEYAYKEI